MTYSFKAFIISLLIHVSVFATIINFETFKEKKRDYCSKYEYGKRDNTNKKTN